MNNRDLFGLSIRNLLRRRTRTILAVVGVIVGTCAIVVMLSIGFGLSENFKEQVASYGNLHLITVYSSGGGGGMSYSGGGGMYSSSSGSGGTQKEAKLDDKAAATFMKIPGVDAASPTVSEYLTFGIGKYVASAPVVGINPIMMEKLGYEIDKGRMLQQGDKFAVVFGNQIPMQFYNPYKTMGNSWNGEAAVDVMSDKLIITGDYEYGQKPRPGNGGSSPEEKIVYKEYKAKGVGILANPSDESSYSVYMNIKTVQTMKDELRKARKERTSRTDAKSYESIMVYVGDINNVQQISDQIRSMGYQTQSLNDLLKNMQKTASMIQGVLGGIGAISLFVAALGITNTMIMSIYERTREIGVMKVIGANLRDIRRMFLLEAGLIGLIGGILGLLLSLLISWLMNTFLAQIMANFLGTGGSSVSIIPWWVALGALVFATSIGIISGYSPARRAMRLSALESLKNE